MTDDWKTEYRRAMLTVILRRGTPAESFDYYGSLMSPEQRQEQNDVLVALAAGRIDFDAIRMEETDWHISSPEHSRQTITISTGLICISRSTGSNITGVTPSPSENFCGSFSISEEKPCT